MQLYGPDGSLLLQRSEQYEAFSRLVKRFRAVRSHAYDVYLSGLVQPVTDMDALLSEPKGIMKTTAYTAGQNGPTTVLTVPDDKRWTIYNIRLNLPTGDNHLTGIRFYDASEDQDVAVTVSTALTSVVFNPGLPVRLDRADEIRGYLNGDGVAAGSLTGEIWVEEEDAY